jgi:hypothetical protein
VLVSDAAHGAVCEDRLSEEIARAEYGWRYCFVNSGNDLRTRPDLSPLFGSLQTEDHDRLLDLPLRIDDRLLILAEEASRHVGVRYERVGLGLFAGAAYAGLRIRRPGLWTRKSWSSVPTRNLTSTAAARMCLPASERWRALQRLPSMY